MANNCPKCNYEVDTNENYDCPKCGEKFWQSKEKFENHFKLLDPFSSENKKTEVEKTEIEKNQYQSKKYCENCKNNDDNANYCIYCGQKIDSKSKTENKTEGKNTKIVPYTAASSRALNLILDSTGCFLLLVFFSYCLSWAGLTWLEDKYEIWFIIIVYYLYYFIFELIFNKTPAKWISNTKVKMQDNSKPKILSIAIRTLTRLIFIEFMTFYGSYPLGLHDRISKTMVVDDKGKNAL